MRRDVAIAVGVLTVLLIALASYLILRSRHEHVNLILTNGVVYTADDRHPRAEALAITEGKITAVGTSIEIADGYAADSVWDLRGHTVVPGFIDAHAHLESLGATLVTLDLSQASSLQETCEMVGMEAGAGGEGRWIRGRGWDQNRWSHKVFPTARDLDPVSPRTPVVLARVDGHAVWVNTLVIQKAGVTSRTPDPEGGKIIRDARGVPSGVFVDNAMELIYAILPQPTQEERQEALTRAARMCAMAGLTEVHDMGVDREGIALYRKLIAAKALPLRIYAAIEGTGETWQEYLRRGPDMGGEDGRLTVRALKMYADGALGSRGAALIEPYSDEPGNRGLTVTAADTLLAAARQALDHGFQLCIHAIGDRANTIVLNVYRDAFKSFTGNSRAARFRVEHAQVLSADDIPRFKELGVIPSMQPAHCTSDMAWAVDRLGPKRSERAYAWRSLLDRGNIIPAGSDFPVERPSPLLGFYAAITRQDLQGRPEGGWHPEQRMTRDEALKAFTIWAAYAAFQEKVKGSLEPGKWADVVVLGRDIMNAEPALIPTTPVEMTMVGGKVEYLSASAPWMR